MNRKLYDTIYTFAEDNEIDYNGLIEVAHRFGKTFANEPKLCEFKQAVDKFLITRSLTDLNLVESLLSEDGGNISWWAKDDIDHQPQNDLRKDFTAEYEKYMAGKPKSSTGPDERSGKKAGSGKWERDHTATTDDANEMPRRTLRKAGSGLGE